MYTTLWQNHTLKGHVDLYHVEQYNGTTELTSLINIPLNVFFFYFVVNTVFISHPALQYHIVFISAQ